MVAAYIGKKKEEEKNDNDTTTGAVLLQLFSLSDTFFVCLWTMPPYFARDSTQPTPWHASLQN